MNRKHLDLYDTYAQWRASKNIPFPFENDTSMLVRQKLSDWSRLSTCLPTIGSHSGSGVSRKKDYICAITIIDGFQDIKGAPSEIGMHMTSVARAIPFDIVSPILNRMEHVHDHEETKAPYHQSLLTSLLKVLTKR